MVSAVNDNSSPMSLRDLCAKLDVALEISGKQDVPILGITADSRRVRPGFVFAAIRGTKSDGHSFISDALARGAVAVLTDRLGTRSSGATLIRSPDPREALAALSARWWRIERPMKSGELRLFGITGTNGKSTTCYLIQAVLHHAKHRCANIGTIEYDLVTRRVKSDLTTPDAPTLSEMLAEARQAGARRAVMEVSSHALDQRRTDGLRFSTAVFTNLTGDHHDYHGSAEAYGAAKKRLFDLLSPQGLALVNSDDPHAKHLVSDCRAQVVRYGLAAGAQLRGEILEMSPAGIHMRVHHGGMTWSVRTGLVGRHNAYNVLAAFGVALGDGISPRTVVQGISALKSVPGRLERVGGTDCPVDVFVDYAHTDDALVNVLTAARQICRRRLVVVFGCGGDRDRSKRPRMARVAAEWADRIVVTSDNPRNEDPRTIIEDILRGFPEKDRCHILVEPERERALACAIEQAEPEDLVLIAGKGHEDYQIVGDRRREFDDRVVAAKILEKLFGVRT